MSSVKSEEHLIGEKVDDNVHKALETFIKKMGYRENPKILGIVFYGSSLTGYSSKDSDVDVHVITTNTSELIRGVTNISGFKIEYFEKPILDLYMTTENEFNSQNNAILAMIGCGEIIYERKGIITALQDYIKIKYANGMLPLEPDEAKETVCVIDNRMIRLQKMLEIDDPDFDHNYHLYLERIRTFYHRLLGCPEIPASKVRRIYTDVAFRTSFCKDYVPDDDFIYMYLEAISCTGSKEEKMRLIRELFDYSRRNDGKIGRAHV